MNSNNGVPPHPAGITLIIVSSSFLFSTSELKHPMTIWLPFSHFYRCFQDDNGGLTALLHTGDICQVFLQFPATKKKSDEYKRYLRSLGLTRIYRVTESDVHIWLQNNPTLATKSEKLMGVDQQTAVLVQPSKQTTQKKPPAFMLDANKGVKNVPKLERGAISGLIRNILSENTRNGVVDYTAIHEAVKNIAGDDYPKRRVYTAVKEATKTRAKKKGDTTPQKQLTASRTKPETASPPPHPKSIDAKIAEVKGSIVNLQADLQALERAKQIMES